MLAKVRNLWRFDGDTEPVRVSRRTFLFTGGVVAAGAALPIQPAVFPPAVFPEWFGLNAAAYPPVFMFRDAAMSGYRIAEVARIERAILAAKGRILSGGAWV